MTKNHLSQSHHFQDREMALEAWGEGNKMFSSSQKIQYNGRGEHLGFMLKYYNFMFHVSAAEIFLRMLSYS